MGLELNFPVLQASFRDEDASLTLRPLRRMSVTQMTDIDPSFASNRYVTSTITARGLFNGPPRRLIYDTMRVGNTVAVDVTDTQGGKLTGSIYLEQVKLGGKRNVDIALSGVLSGVWTERDQKSQTRADIGEKLNLIEGRSYRKGYQDDRIDRVVRPWFTDGLTAANNMLATAIDNVVASAGGATHACDEDTTLQLYSVEGKPFDHTAAFGFMTYARGPLDCSPYAPTITTGFVDSYEAEPTAAESVSAGGACDVSGITFTGYVRARRAVKQIHVPCYFGTTPPTEPTTMMARINDAAVLLNGVSYGAFELRFDGFDTFPTYVDGTKHYPGIIKYTWHDNGWFWLKRICVRSVPVIEAGNTLPSYVLQFGEQVFYQYASATFTDVDTMCPNCYSGSSAWGAD